MRQSIQGKLKLPSFLFVGSDNQLLTTPPHLQPAAGWYGASLRSALRVSIPRVQSPREGYVVPLITSREYLLHQRQ